MLQRSLRAAADLMKMGERQSDPILSAALFHLQKSSQFRIDYLSIVDAENLEPVSMIRKPAILALAGFYGQVRLIDHIELLP